MTGKRMTRKPTPPPPVVLPPDVRLTQAVASAIYGLAVLAAMAALALWLSRSPMFRIHSVRVEGELQRVHAQALRSRVAPRLADSFFGVDLPAVRDAFEAVPWVRRASVRRVWPDRLVVTIEEHRAAALWLDDERDDRLVNEQGEVFSANVGDVEDESLPTLGGPEGSAPALLSMVRRLRPLLGTLEMQVQQLQLSARGSWRVLLDSGARLELGRGSEDELLLRAQRFVGTLAQVTARLDAPLEYADLRHTGGYAVRLRGIATTDSAPAGPRRTP
ncbi:MAG TPA: cell division protein FtsQ/DivIB [Rubrivivax sp.]|nr:cell division protein FtsQ/DivIB [Burkholderiales bacterium]HNU10219.1 cell division protein FtsQ/DivIB [Rubrivivax sp.]